MNVLEQTPTYQIDKKLELFKRLCSDVEYRAKLFEEESSQILLQKLELRDFPLKTLLSCPPFDLTKSLLPYEYCYAKVNGKRDKRFLKITTPNQEGLLARLLSTKETGEGILTIISGISDFQKARFLGFLLVFVKLRSKSKETTAFKPYWYYVKGGFDDQLRDMEELRSQKGSLNYLVLDGLALSSSKLKMEKFNDLLSIYQNSRVGTDVIVIGAGFDPLKIAAECLNTTFQAGFYLDEGLIVSF